MIEQFFGTKTETNEQFILDSILEHTMIDEEKLFLLKNMVTNLCDKNFEEVDTLRQKILSIRNDSNHIFEHIEEQIIQAHFDFQKQYDFLRIFQRIESISSEILRCANYLSLFVRLNGTFPTFCFEEIENLIDYNLQAHEFFKKALMIYEKNKKDVISSIHNVVSIKGSIHKSYFNGIETIYRLSNEGSLKLGDMRSIENIFTSLEHLGNTIESASTSLEWLLIT
ncbi:hypothetical protein DID74_02170 [Candidatus Marinamargulisbacteria bacterium SCGC AG-333-B06]|nr:hypothetical protein DID74_02170 [Candidatus Marinamargulisbacteria bacterium SCGC AG-333-B06]